MYLIKLILPYYKNLSNRILLITVSHTNLGMRISRSLQILDFFLDQNLFLFLAPCNYRYFEELIVDPTDYPRNLRISKKMSEETMFLKYKCLIFVDYQVKSCL